MHRRRLSYRMRRLLFTKDGTNFQEQFEYLGYLLLSEPYAWIMCCPKCFLHQLWLWMVAKRFCRISIVPGQGNLNWAKMNWWNYKTSFCKTLSQTFFTTVSSYDLLRCYCLEVFLANSSQNKESCSEVSLEVYKSLKAGKSGCKTFKVTTGARLSKWY